MQAASNARLYWAHCSHARRVRAHDRSKHGLARPRWKAAKAGIVTPQMRAVAETKESTSRLCANAWRHCGHSRQSQPRLLHPCGVGEGLRTKINTVRPGISRRHARLRLRDAQGRRCLEVRRRGHHGPFEHGKRMISPRARGRNPPRRSATRPYVRRRRLSEKDPGPHHPAQRLFEVVRAHAEEGVDFVTIHGAQSQGRST